MNLIIDVGNTAIKLAVFNKTGLVDKKVINQNQFATTLHQLTEQYPLSHAILSKVGILNKEFVNYLQEKLKTLIFTNNAHLPFKNLYSTPKTIGVDRLALAAAATQNYPHKNVLIIDAGSCITYDFLNKKNEYLGGAISPGVTMRYKALNQFTANLPLLEKENPNSFIGNSTHSSIHTGVTFATTLEIDGFINQYKTHYDSFISILTGGDANFLLDNIKNDIFVHQNFLLEGLNHILELNKDLF